MRRAVLLLIFLAAGCTAEPPKPSKPPEPPKLTGRETTGEKVNIAHRYCLAVADQQCPGYTIYCDAFRAGLVKQCLVRSNVPPEYILLLTTPY